MSIQLRHVSSVKTDIILLGEIRSKHFEDIIMHKFDYQKISANYNESFSKSIVVSLRSTFVSLFFCLFGYRKYYTFKSLFSSNYDYSLKSHILLSYYYGIIRVISPKVIVSFGGSVTTFFSLLNKVLCDIDCLSLSLFQLRKRDFNNIFPSIAQYHVWGDNDKKGLINIGYPRDKIHVVGSMISGISNTIIDTPEKNKIYDICLISTIYKELFSPVESNEDILVNFVVNYLRLNPSLKICVALRPHNDMDKGRQREIDFYSERLSNFDFDFIESDQDNFSTYRAISLSKVVIVQNSCVGFEAMASGSRVLFCQPYDFGDLSIPFYRLKDDLVYGVTSNNQTKFSNHLDELFSITDAKYMINVKRNIDRYCIFDIKNPPHKIIQDKITELLLE